MEGNKFSRSILFEICSHKFPDQALRGNDFYRCLPLLRDLFDNGFRTIGIVFDFFGWNVLDNLQSLNQVIVLTTTDFPIDRSRCQQRR